MAINERVKHQVVNVYNNSEDKAIYTFYVIELAAIPLTQLFFLEISYGYLLVTFITKIFLTLPVSPIFINNRCF